MQRYPFVVFTFNKEGMNVHFHLEDGNIHTFPVSVSDCLRLGFDHHRLFLMMEADTEYYCYKEEQEQRRQTEKDLSKIAQISQELGLYD